MVKQRVVKLQHTARRHSGCTRLEVWLRQDAQDAVPRRLRLVRHDGQALPQQRVHQRGLARVGPPNDGHKACKWTHIMGGRA